MTIFHPGNPRRELAVNIPGLEISKGGLSNTYKKCISRADFALLTRTLSISKAPSFLLYLYLRYLHINYPITYVYLRFLTTLLRFFDYFT